MFFKYLLTMLLLCKCSYTNAIRNPSADFPLRAKLTEGGAGVAITDFDRNVEILSPYASAGEKYFVTLTRNNEIVDSKYVDATSGLRVTKDGAYTLQVDVYFLNTFTKEPVDSWSKSFNVQKGIENRSATMTIGEETYASQQTFNTQLTPGTEMTFSFGEGIVELIVIFEDVLGIMPSITKIATHTHPIVTWSDTPGTYVFKVISREHFQDTSAQLSGDINRSGNPATNGVVPLISGLVHSSNNTAKIKKVNGVYHGFNIIGSGAIVDRYIVPNNAEWISIEFDQAVDFVVTQDSQIINSGSAAQTTLPIGSSKLAFGSDMRYFDVSKQDPYLYINENLIVPTVDEKQTFGGSISLVSDGFSGMLLFKKEHGIWRAGNISSSLSVSAKTEYKVVDGGTGLEFFFDLDPQLFTEPKIYNKGALTEEKIIITKWSQLDIVPEVVAGAVYDVTIFKPSSDKTENFTLSGSVDETLMISKGFISEFNTSPGTYIVSIFYSVGSNQSAISKRTLFHAPPLMINGGVKEGDLYSGNYENPVITITSIPGAKSHYELFEVESPRHKKLVGYGEINENIVRVTKSGAAPWSTGVYELHIEDEDGTCLSHTAYYFGVITPQYSNPRLEYYDSFNTYPMVDNGKYDIPSNALIYYPNNFDSKYEVTASMNSTMANITTDADSKFVWNYSVKPRLSQFLPGIVGTNNNLGLSKTYYLVKESDVKQVTTTMLAHKFTLANMTSDAANTISVSPFNSQPAANQMMLRNRASATQMYGIVDLTNVNQLTLSLKEGNTVLVSRTYSLGEYSGIIPIGSFFLGDVANSTSNISGYMMANPNKIGAHTLEVDIDGSKELFDLEVKALDFDLSLYNIEQESNVHVLDLAKQSDFALSIPQHNELISYAELVTGTSSSQLRIYKIETNGARNHKATVGMDLADVEDSKMTLYFQELLNKETLTPGEYELVFEYKADLVGGTGLFENQTKEVRFHIIDSREVFKRFEYIPYSGGKIKYGQDNNFRSGTISIDTALVSSYHPDYNYIFNIKSGDSVKRLNQPGTLKEDLAGDLYHTITIHARHKHNIQEYTREFRIN